MKLFIISAQIIVQPKGIPQTENCLVLGFKDANGGWSDWMAVVEVGVKARYRGCSLYSNNNTECTPEFQRVSINAKEPSPSCKLIIDLYPGG